MQSQLGSMEIPELLLLVMETSLVSLCMKIMSILIMVILYGRMIEIYLYCSVAPIPFATMTNREWGQIGNNLSYRGYERNGGKRRHFARGKTTIYERRGFCP